MKINKIVFSPTGGTEKVAQIVAEEFGDEIYTIDLSDPNTDYSKIQIDQNDLIILAVPSFNGRVPTIALERLALLNGNNARTLLITSYGNRDFDDTLIELYDKAKEKGFLPFAAIAAVTEHSILPQYATGRPDNEDVEELKSFITNLKDLEEYPVLPGNRPYKKSMNLPIVPKKKSNCNQCQICLIQCPVNAINERTLKADKDICISCMRCVKNCPTHSRTVNKLVSTIASLALKKSAAKRKPNQLFQIQ